MKHLVIVTTLLILSCKTFAYNPFSTHKDKKLISTLVEIDKSKPRDIEQYFKNQLHITSSAKENLGFGWTIWTPFVSGGYISISANFYYYHDSLISYSLTSRLPDRKGLRKRYTKWYDNYFDYADAAIQPYNFNDTSVFRPLKEFNGDWKNIASKIVNYMMPGSGTMYGHAWDGGIMQNRKAFLEIKDSLTADQIVLLMYSINPASRLTAIEYYLQHENLFSSRQSINNWIGVVFKETPTIETMSGCFRMTLTPQDLFPQYYLDRYYR